MVEILTISRDLDPKDKMTETDFPWPVYSYPGKRAVDIVVSLILLILLFPLLVVIALLIKLTSRGPVFYRGLRAGLRGRPFWQLKFRTMYVGRAGGAFTAKDDVRVTPVGRILRLLRLDELPQLINVLKGDMSLVGPRPEDFRTVQTCYTRQQMRVLAARPGLTSPVAVKYFPGLEYTIPDGVDAEQYYKRYILPQRLEEDLEYIDTMSFMKDMVVLWQTLYCIAVKSWKHVVGKEDSPSHDHDETLRKAA